MTPEALQRGKEIETEIKKTNQVLKKYQDFDPHVHELGMARCGAHVYQEYTMPEYIAAAARSLMIDYLETRLKDLTDEMENL